MLDLIKKMKIYLVILLALVISISCKNRLNSKKNDIVKSEYKEIINDVYELSKPINNIKGVLILFGGYSENAEAIKREFSIVDKAKNKNIAILYLNLNHKLWIDKNERIELSQLFQKIFKNNKLPLDNVYIGGFSSGGNISLLISNHLVKEKSIIQPKGVFVVDSPVDLLALYQLYERNIKRNFSENSVKEANWLLNVFNTELGNPIDGIRKFEENSPFTSESNYIENVSNLNNLKIRFYTEPDTIWWKANRQNEPKDLNAFSIEKLTNKLEEKFDKKNIELIKTIDKGYRSNGVRHPHSWSIIDKDGLIDWMTKK